MPLEKTVSVIRHNFHYIPLQLNVSLIGHAVAFKRWRGQSDSTLYSRVEFSWSRINDGNWHHYATTYWRGIHKIWIDGVNVSSENHSSVSLPNDSNNPWVFGGREKVEGRVEADYTGALDDVRIYNYALSEAEIKALYADGEAEQHEKAEAP